jgi:hypothetical protein
MLLRSVTADKNGAQILRMNADFFFLSASWFDCAHHKPALICVLFTGQI